MRTAFHAPGREGVGTRDRTAMVRVGPKGRAGAFSPWCCVSGGAQPAAGMHQGLPDWMFLQLAGIRLKRIPVLSAGNCVSAVHGGFVAGPAQEVMRHDNANLTQVPSC